MIMLRLMRLSWGGEYSTHGRDWKSIQNFRWKAWEERLLGRPRSRCNRNIKTDYKVIRRKSVGLIQLDQNRNHGRGLVNTVMNLWFLWLYLLPERLNFWGRLCFMELNIPLLSTCLWDYHRFSSTRVCVCVCVERGCHKMECVNECVNECLCSDN